MTVLVGIAVGKIELFVETVETTVVEIARHLAVRDIVKREYIHVESPYPFQMETLHYSGVAILQLGEIARIAVVGRERHHSKPVIEPLRGVFHEDVIILARHTHVYIIIPWNKTLVTDGSQERTGYHIVSQAMLTAHLIDRNEKSQALELEFPYTVWFKT